MFGDALLSVCFSNTFYLFLVSLKVFTSSMYMGIFGSGSPKRHRLLSNDEELLMKIHTKAGYMSREDQQKCDTQLVKKYIDKNGCLRCVGLKAELRESAHLVILGFPKQYMKRLQIDYICNMCVLTYQNESGDSCCKICLHLRHYPPAFGEFVAALALELQNVAWAGGFIVWLL